MARGKYKRKRRRMLQRRITVHMLGFPARIADTLMKNGIMTLADLIRYSNLDLLRLPGINDADVIEIQFGLQQVDVEKPERR